MAEGKEVKVSYRGWPGHFICGDRCVFRLNTLLECGNTRIVVSTVGLMRDRLDEGFQQIGHNRHFETMAFHAKENEEFWDADVQREVFFDSQWAWEKPEDEWAANKGHWAVVEEIKRKLGAGETFPDRAEAA